MGRELGFVAPWPFPGKAEPSPQPVVKTSSRLGRTRVRYRPRPDLPAQHRFCGRERAKKRAPIIEALRKTCADRFSGQIATKIVDNGETWPVSSTRSNSWSTGSEFQLTERLLLQDAAGRVNSMPHKAVMESILTRMSGWSSVTGERCLTTPQRRSPRKAHPAGERARSHPGHQVSTRGSSIACC